MYPSGFACQFILPSSCCVFEFLFSLGLSSAFHLLSSFICFASPSSSQLRPFVCCPASLTRPEFHREPNRGRGKTSDIYQLAPKWTSRERKRKKKRGKGKRVRFPSCPPPGSPPTPLTSPLPHPPPEKFTPGVIHRRCFDLVPRSPTFLFWSPSAHDTWKLCCAVLDLVHAQQTVLSVPSLCTRSRTYAPNHQHKTKKFIPGTFRACRWSKEVCPLAFITYRTPPSTPFLFSVSHRPPRCQPTQATNGPTSHTFSEKGPS